MVPLGLYRWSEEDEFQYVYLNCSKDTILHEKDQIFVLSKQQPRPL